ncbi:MAG: septal ring lytic transglycosylase RlpA family protein [Apibacter sp.]|jgi:rare lipoprotein A|nr:septal ring lytic transglycosylase RlpA family protein [Apibacter sp.]
MKKVTLALMIILLVSLSFTIFNNEELVKAPSLTNVPGDTIKINNQNDSLTSNVFNEDNDYNEKSTLSGRVSWYGGKFHGRLTSSGERYNMNDFTAAHKTLPFGTKVKIINPKNGKEVIVRITDRGPFVPKREFDLSKAAFAELTSLTTGVINVNYEIL